MKKTKKIKVSHAETILGTKSELSRVLGLTRGAVNIWAVSDGLVPSKYTKRLRAAIRARKRKIDKSFDLINK